MIPGSGTHQALVAAIQHELSGDSVVRRREPNLMSASYDRSLELDIHW